MCFQFKEVNFFCQPLRATLIERVLKKQKFSSEGEDVRREDYMRCVFMMRKEAADGMWSQKVWDYHVISLQQPNTEK